LRVFSHRRRLSAMVLPVSGNMGKRRSRVFANRYKGEPWDRHFLRAERFAAEKIWIANAEHPAASWLLCCRAAPGTSATFVTVQRDLGHPL